MALINKPIKSWADAARNSEWKVLPNNDRSIDILQSVLEGKTAPDAGAASIASLYEPLIKYRISPPPVNHLWALFCDAATTIGGNNKPTERLVELLGSIRALPDVTDKHGSAICHEWVNEGVYWRRLPYLSLTLWEYAIDIDEDDTEGTEWDGPAVPILNATAFLAMFLDRVKPDRTFFSLDGMCIGVETPYETPEDYRDGAIYIPPAATWILLAGKVLYEFCKNDFIRRDNPPGYAVDEASCEWQHGRGYSLARWAFWKKRFGVITMTQGLHDDIRDLAAKAIIKMDEIESQMN